MENFFDLTRKRQERQPVTNTSNSESGGSRTANPIWEFFVKQSNGKARLYCICIFIRRQS